MADLETARNSAAESLSKEQEATGSQARERDELTQEVQRLREEKTLLDMHATTLKGKGQQAMDQIRTDTALYLKLQKRAETLQNESREAAEYIQILKQQVLDFKAEKDEKVSQLEDERARGEQELEALEQRVQRAREEAQEDLDELRDDIEERSTEQDQLVEAVVPLCPLR
jgi:chromosome segregation ATPase